MFPSSAKNGSGAGMDVEEEHGARWKARTAGGSSIIGGNVNTGAAMKGVGRMTHVDGSDVFARTDG